MDKRLKENPDQFLNIYSREARVLDVNDEKRMAELVVATEQPVVVMDWAKWEPVREIVLIEGLRHPDSVIMLDTHSRWSTNDIKGAVKDFEIKKNYEKLGTVKIGNAYFSKTADKEWTLRQEGFLTDSSIGYRVNDKETVIIAPGQSQKVNGKEYRNDYGDSLPLYIRTGADLMEVSLVPIGADQAAKFRSMYSQEQEEIQKRFNEQNNTQNKKDPKMENEKTNQAALEVKEDLRVKEEQRVAGIKQLVTNYKDKVKGLNLVDLQDAYVQGERSVSDFSQLITDNIVKNVQEAAAKPTIELSAKEIKDYSLARGIKSIFNRQNSLEIEISSQYSKETGLVSEANNNAVGFFMPHQVAAKGLRFKGRNGMMQRDVNTTATTGGDFVGTDHLGGNWIDALLAKLILTDLGVIYLPGRKGNIEIPKLTSGNTFGWASTENAATTESTPATTEVTMTPKRGGTFVDVSKQAIIQSDPSLDVILTNNGQTVMALGFEAGAFHGTGSSGQFTGIENLTSINGASMASVTWQKVLDAIKEIKSDKADLGELKWATNAAGEAILRGRAKETGYPIYLIGDDGRLAGRQVAISESISTNYLFLGSFNQAYMAFWDVLDVIVDPYQFAQYGLIRITFNQLADFAVRHDQAFFKASDLS